MQIRRVSWQRIALTSLLVAGVTSAVLLFASLTNPPYQLPPESLKNGLTTILIRTNIGGGIIWWIIAGVACGVTTELATYHPFNGSAQKQIGVIVVALVLTILLMALTTFHSDALNVESCCIHVAFNCLSFFPIAFFTALVTLVIGEAVR